MTPDRATAWAARLRPNRTPEIDLTLPGLGAALGTGSDRLRVASGTRDEQRYRRRVRLLQRMWADGDPHVHLPLFRALIARKLRLADLDRAMQQDGEVGLVRLARTLRQRSLAEAVTAFLDSERCPPKSRKQYTAQLADFVAYATKTVGASVTVAAALDQPVIKAYLRQLTRKHHARGTVGEPVSPATRNRYRAAISALATFCLHEKWITAHPLILGQVPIVEEAPPRMPDLTPEEVATYCAGVDRFGDEERSLAIRVLLHTGPDVGEVLSRRVAHLVPDGVGLRLQFKRSKVRRSPTRLVPIPAELAAALRGWVAAQRLQPRDRLFPTLTARKLEKGHDYGLKALGDGATLRLKDLRHLAAQGWRRAGVDLQTVQEWLGHTSLAQTLVYSAFGPQPDHEHPLVERAAAMRGSSRVLPRVPPGGRAAPPSAAVR